MVKQVKAVGTLVECGDEILVLLRIKVNLSGQTKGMWV